MGTPEITFNAGTLARGWLATAVASGDDAALPVLYSTVLVEFYPHGIRLSATDRVLLLTTWVPSSDDPEAAEPGLDEAPDERAIASDPDGRGRALLGYLRKLAAKAAKDGFPAPEVTIRIGELDEAASGDAPFPGMEREQVEIEYEDHERVALPIVDGAFPEYRGLLLGYTPGDLSDVALGPKPIQQLAHLTRIVSEHVTCTFAGPRKPIALTVGKPPVYGVVMPVVMLADVIEAATP